MKSESVRDQIVQTASRLFYDQGYNATGINQIIAEAGVAKASLYQHFPSKDDLLKEYLKITATDTLSRLKKSVASHKDLKGKVSALFDHVKQAARKSDYHGCNFLNVIAEIPASNLKVRKLIQEQKNDIRNLIQDILRDAKAKDVSDEIYLLFEAALVAGKVHRREWAIDKAKGMALKLI